jgi:mono/diheme cytochrome c family protein
MRRGWKILGIVFISVVLLLAGAITLTIGWRPFIGPRARPLTDRKFEATPERLARGKYLTENTLDCFACHSQRDWTTHDAPLIPGTEGGGAAPLPLEDPAGTINVPNISPDKETGAGNWTDDQLERAIREGIGHDGRALFPMMPYQNFRYLSDEDLASVIVYLRSIPPVHHVVPKIELVFPVKYLIRSVPQPITAPVPPPDLSTPVKRGEWLVRVAGCRDCHTPQKMGQPLPGLDLAGGFVLKGPWGYVASANITPDPSGIPYYDETLFLKVMHTGFVNARELKPVMTWWDYRSLTDEDLKAMFAYLRTVPPIKHRVDNTEPPTPCKICGNVHGAGDRN